MKPDVILANAGPLIALEGIGQLVLLDRFFHRVLVPEAVHEEIGGSAEKGAFVLPPGVEVAPEASPIDPLISEMLDKGKQV